ncbi:pentapeptide repeat-containing protein [Paraglaciecola chathamensis]|uniref:pentapeptide repeat-containing protein n=1 Tax=Paraglaciecola chathamensis TaxID=368405 RepID=UPI0027065C30|nr:pentapeptide repeat-containing protein [Paraglaciecola chathamensis]MDO6560887.1 pentapeptide repeat-containing protein [Paraglaciecola chathamensis]
MKNTEPGKVFLVAALSLSTGVPLALFAVYYFAESAQYIAGFILILLFTLTVIGILLSIFWKRIVASVIMKPSSSISAAIEPLSDALSDIANTDYQSAKENLRNFGQSAGSLYSWLVTRQWLLSGSLGLLLGFSALVGSALLKQQNDLITKQNEFFRQQIDQQQTQIQAQQNVANQTIRNEAINRIYGAAYSNSPRVRAEAVRSLIAVERLLIASGTNTLPTDYINLNAANLEDAWLSNADLKKVSFRKANLTEANLSSADLTGSVFRFSDIPGADFIGTVLRNSSFMFVRGQNSTFSRANLTNANLNQSDFSDSDFSGANFQRTNLFKVDFSGANLSGITNWEAISNISGTNLFNLEGAPDGFVEWALQNGAVSEENELSNLESLRSEMLETEEGK